MSGKLRRISGFGLIFVTWFIWGMIFLIPFLHMGTRVSAIVITILLASTNLFWVGIILLGKEYAEKFQIRARLKRWLGSKNTRKDG